MDPTGRAMTKSTKSRSPTRKAYLPTASAGKPKRTDKRRDVPSVDGLMRSAAGRKASDRLGRPLVKRTLQAVLDDVRAGAARGVTPPEDAAILARALQAAARAPYGMA